MTFRQRRASRPETDQGFWKTGLGFLTQGALLLGAIAGLVGAVAALTGGSKSDSRPTSAAPPAPRLELVDLSVRGGTPARCLKEKAVPQTVDLSVRNAGELPAIVKRIGFRVLATAHLTPVGRGGGLEPSHNYDVAFPFNPRISQLVTYRVSQAIAAKAVDRFTVRLDEHEPFRQEGTELHRLQVLLYHDTARTPLDAGTIIVALPFVPVKEYFMSGVPPEFRSHYRGTAEGHTLEGNERFLRAMLAAPGARAPTLSLALVNTSVTGKEPNPCQPAAQQPQAPEEGQGVEAGA